MTVTYGDANPMRLLLRWKGSLWKSVWLELFIFLALFIGINLTYRFALNGEQREQFQAMVHFTSNWVSYIPIQFLLGFYVSYVMDRWWTQVTSIPYPDKFLLFMTTHIAGNDKKRKLIRRTIGRWILLHCVLIWRELSKKIKKRFPTDAHLLKSGLITQEEYILYANIPDTYGKWWAPINWAAGILRDCFDEEMFKEETLESLLEKLYAIRGSNGTLAMYDWINVPLRYIQVTTFATYGYFALCLVGRQTVSQTFESTNIDLYIPVVTVIEFVFYIGWLKVAEVARLPFGDDDDDFDMNFILDRNFQVTQLIVDEIASQRPKISEDLYFNKPHKSLPHTKASFQVRDRIPKWRIAGLKLSKEDLEYQDPPLYTHGSTAVMMEAAELDAVKQNHLLVQENVDNKQNKYKNRRNSKPASQNARSNIQSEWIKNSTSDKKPGLAPLDVKQTSGHGLHSSGENSLYDKSLAKKMAAYNE